ncbi:SWIB/MDM2 domain-containing protein [Mycotypha africana]|uniref:SWIB/MDM2 domain-containing protein n=1 Tax=Mycotypha africana TaxID=64632 RepID=UPI002301F294|nr:SWIB/MDM2 domain-containing protein [Mycotypha africana]KAI8971546.1 SWIB/MDM2 domain-containing protein [Mycotypha africana]
MAEQYRADIEEILRQSDLSTVTTKKIRKALEAKRATSLDSIKKEINGVIESVFLTFQEKQSKVQQEAYSPPVVQKDRIPKTTQSAIKKPTTPRKKKTEKEPVKRSPKWPIFKVLPPLLYVVSVDYCTRPQAVKKIWAYIKQRGLQSETNKKIINCDANLKELFGGNDQVDAFGMNKFIGQYLDKIPKEEQEKQRQLIQERDEQEEQP